MDISAALGIFSASIHFSTDEIKKFIEVLWFIISGIVSLEYAYLFDLFLILMLTGLCFFLYKLKQVPNVKYGLAVILFILYINNRGQGMAKEELNENTRARLMERRYGRNLPSPGIIVYPEALVIDYYHTGAAEPKLNSARGYNHRWPLQEGPPIAIRDIFGEIDTNNVTYVAIVGGPGDGKTETAKNFALDVLNKKIPVLEEIEVVKYIDITDLSDVKKLYTTGELLCMGIQRRHHCIKLVIKNPHKFMLIADGIDKIESNLGQNLTQIDFNESHSATKILNNLFSGRVLQGIKILITSRRHGIRKFEPGMRPQRIIALNGLAKVTIEKLVKAFGAEKGGEIWKSLESKYKPLLRLCQSPLFLTYTVSILKNNERASLKTMTQILLKTIYDFTTSSTINQGSSWNISDTLHELKSIAFDAKNKGTRIFMKSQLPKNLEAIKNLFTVTPRRSYQGDHLREEHYVYSFIHETLQETLAALHVAEMSANDFKIFLDETILTSGWGFVHKVMTGLILNNETWELARDVDSVGLLRENRDIQLLKEHLDTTISDSVANTLYNLVNSRLTDGEHQLRWKRVILEYKKMVLESINAFKKLLDDRKKTNLALNAIQEISLEMEIRLNSAFEQKIGMCGMGQNDSLTELLNQLLIQDRHAFPEPADAETYDLFRPFDVRTLNSFMFVQCIRKMSHKPSDVKSRNQQKCGEIVREMEGALKHGMIVIKSIYGEKLFQTLWKKFINYDEFWQRPDIIGNFSAIKLEEVTDPKKWEEIVRNTGAVIERGLDIFEFVDFAYDDLDEYYNEIIPQIYSYINSDAFKKDDFKTVFLHFIKYVCDSSIQLLRSNWKEFSTSNWKLLYLNIHIFLRRYDQEFVP